jgi:hypothetical protein
MGGPISDGDGAVFLRWSYETFGIDVPVVI